MYQLEAFLTEPVARDAFIGAMRAVASSVTVVTTDGPAGRHGATVNAFCSVSADPPSALVCLKADSRIARTVAANREFCVNVLPRSWQDIADRFAGRNGDAVADRFAGIDCAPVCGVTPAIAGATAFTCHLQETVAFGTHRIFVGLVVQVREGAPEPLTYLNGAYHRVIPQTAAMRPGPDAHDYSQNASQ